MVCAEGTVGAYGPGATQYPPKGGEGWDAPVQEETPKGPWGWVMNRVVYASS